MYLIGLLDSFSASFTISAIIILFLGIKKKTPRPIKITLGLLLVAFFLYYFFMLLEWYEISTKFDRYEDLVGIVIPILWTFLFYLFFQSILSNELHVCDSKLKAIFDDANGYYMILEPQPDGDLKIREINNSASRLHGYSRDELLGKKLSELCLNFNKAKSRKLNLEILSGKPYSGERSYLLKNGSTINVNVQSCRLSLSGNSPMILNVEHDITDIIEAKKEISKLILFPDQNPAPVMRCNKDGLLIYANESSKKLLESWHIKVNDPIPKSWNRKIHEALSFNRIVTSEAEYDGTFMSLNICPIDDATYVNIYGYDITERKAAEEQLRKNEALLNDAGNIAIIGGWEFEVPSGNPTWTKQTYDIVEIDPEAPVPDMKQHLDYYLPEYRTMAQNSITQLLENNLPFSYEARIKTAKGNIKWCRANGRAERKGGKCVRIYGTFQDITMHKKVEEELEQHRKNLEMLVSERTSELNKMVKLMSGREVRMTELKEQIDTLSKQLKKAGITPVNERQTDLKE